MKNQIILINAKEKLLTNTISNCIRFKFKESHCHTRNSTLSELEKISLKSVDLLLLYSDINPIDYYLTICHLSDEFPNLKIIILAYTDNGIHNRRLIKAGAIGYHVLSHDIDHLYELMNPIY